MGRIDLCQAVNSAVALDRQDPSLGDQHTSLDFGFVPGTIRTRRRYRTAVMLGHIGVGGIQFRFIFKGFMLPTLEIYITNYPE
jgi:hypothetical protein